MVRALIIIREAWIKVSPSVGTPPILVLSYKNHAIDEFLSDLVEAEPRGKFINKLIRIGGQCKDLRLQPYSEREARRSNLDVKSKRQVLEQLHNMKKKIHQLSTEISLFQSYQFDIFCRDNDDDKAVARANIASSEATSMVISSLLRVRLMTEGLKLIEDSENSSKSHLVFSHLNVIDDALHFSRSDVSYIETTIPELVEGIKHYKRQRPGDIIYEWIRGLKPRPQCIFESKVERTRCDELANSNNPALCLHHQCRFIKQDGQCKSAIIEGKVFCIDHSCEVEDCQLSRTGQQKYCSRHICKRCVELGQVSGLAVDDPPRNVCFSHPLCCNLDCANFCKRDSNYCEEHENPICTAITKKGNKCKNKILSRSIPFCKDHVEKYLGSEKKETRDEKYEKELTPDDLRRCEAMTKKGRPCKGYAKPGEKYCYDHSLPGINPSRREAQDQKLNESASVGSLQLCQPCNKPLTQEFANYADNILDDMKSCEEFTDHNKIKKEDENTVYQNKTNDGQNISIDLNNGADVNPLKNDLEVIDAADDCISVEDGEYNYDDEGEHFKHLREVFELNDGDSDSDDSFSSAHEIDESHQHVCDKPKKQLLFNPSDWNWTMSNEDRWDACQSLMDRQEALLADVMKVISTELSFARKDFANAKIRANARVYENRSIIGGTIVGCIARLQAIRSTNPFAIIVEEARYVSSYYFAHIIPFFDAILFFLVRFLNHSYFLASAVPPVNWK